MSELPRIRPPWALWIAAACWTLAAACEGSGVSARLPCDDTALSAHVTALAAAVDGAEVYPDTTFEGVPGAVIDPTPLGRGEHPVDRWFQDPASCDLLGDTFSWGPPPPSEPPEPLQLPVGGPAHPVRVLLITGDDPGAADDVAAWSAAFEALGAAGAHLDRPPRPAISGALDALCYDAHPGTTAILIATGRATAAGGGALLLGEEAASFAWLRTELATRCAGAGLHVEVFDAARSFVLPAGGHIGPRRTWHASDPVHPDAPRIAPGAGGLLSAALAAHVAELAALDCASLGASPVEVARLFSDAEAVRARMVALRWTVLGGADATPDAVTGDLPHTLLEAAGPAPGVIACLGHDDCAARLDVCPQAACATIGCVDGGCRSIPDEGAPCQDGSACTVGDTCNAQGLCVGKILDCSDDNPCTVEACLWDAGCVSTPVATGTACDDQDVCTLGDACTAAGLCEGAPLDCDDGQECTSDACDPVSGCFHGHAKALCDDGDPCTHQDVCKNGQCTGLPVPCFDGLPCTVDACSAARGCVFVPMPAGRACDDGDPCTTDDRCEDGLCVGAEALCEDGLPCTVDLCGRAGCEHLPVPGTCALSPLGPCVEVGEHPAAAPCLVCQATDVLVPDPALEGAQCADDGIACTEDLCVGGACVHPNAPGTCTAPDGSCVTVGQPLGPCLTCAATGVGAPVATGAVCDDGDPCSTGDACTAQGLCVGEPSACCDAEPVTACGVELSGTTIGAPTLVEAWSCISGITYPDGEASHHFIAPCTGPVTFTFAGPPGLLLFLTRAGVDGTAAADACAVGTCDTYTAGPITLVLDEGEEVVLTVDGNFGVEADYTISLACDDCEALGP